jgi:hypothetical protein
LLDRAQVASSVALAEGSRRLALREVLAPSGRGSEAAALVEAAEGGRVALIVAAADFLIVFRCAR